MATLGPYYLGPDTAHPAHGIYYGDARRLAEAVPDESVDLIFTDPPYPREFMWCWEWLAEFGARVLKPGGTLLAMSGKIWLPEVATALAKHLDYHWLINVDLLKGHGGQAARVWSRKIIENWKPIWWFQKGNYRGKWNSDHVGSSSSDKRYHRWGQSLGAILSTLIKFEGDVVVDPFCGGGTLPVAAKILGRKYLAFEIDLNYCNIARERVRNTQPPLPMAIPEQLSLEAVE